MDGRPIERFSARVSDYLAARPGYPTAIIENLRAAGALPAGAAVADVGSGTGISSALFLDAGCRVFAVEPNDAMRAAAEQQFSGHQGFVSVAGSAEATTLPAASIDLVAAGQAFHWFRPAAAAVEFSRILRLGGWVTLFWNTRDHDATPFMRDLEDLIRRFGTDYEAVHHEQLPDVALAQVMPRRRQMFVMPNRQVLDRQGLHARLLSASYLPPRGSPDAAVMLTQADRLFDQYAEGAAVTIQYRTQQYLGQT